MSLPELRTLWMMAPRPRKWTIQPNGEIERPVSKPATDEFFVNQSVAKPAPIYQWVKNAVHRLQERF